MKFALQKFLILKSLIGQKDSFVAHPENCIDLEQCVEVCTKDVIEFIEGQIPILKSGENSASKN
jgi:NAD-dependent dihydropyrimidine dehydrogenase PreA subunit